MHKLKLGTNLDKTWIKLGKRRITSLDEKIEWRTLWV